MVFKLSLPFLSILSLLSLQLFVLCHGMLQLTQLLVSGYLKSSISTIERRYGFSSQKSGILASFNEVSLNLTLTLSHHSFGLIKIIGRLTDKFQIHIGSDYYFYLYMKKLYTLNVYM